MENQSITKKTISKWDNSFRFSPLIFTTSQSCETDANSHPDTTKP
jgi:hypothetical protein